MVTRLLRKLVHERTCERCTRHEATRGNLCVYCFLDGSFMIPPAQRSLLFTASAMLHAACGPIGTLPPPPTHHGSLNNSHSRSIGQSWEGVRDGPFGSTHSTAMEGSTPEVPMPSCRSAKYPIALP